MFTVDSMNVIDATHQGNKARFINHHCQVGRSTARTSRSILSMLFLAELLRENGRVQGCEAHCHLRSGRYCAWLRIDLRLFVCGRRDQNSLSMRYKSMPKVPELTRRVFVFICERECLQNRYPCGNKTNDIQIEQARHCVCQEWFVLCERLKKERRKRQLSICRCWLMIIVMQESK